MISPAKGTWRRKTSPGLVTKLKIHFKTSPRSQKCVIVEEKADNTCQLVPAQHYFSPLLMKEAYFLNLARFWVERAGLLLWTAAAATSPRSSCAPPEGAWLGRGNCSEELRSGLSADSLSVHAPTSSPCSQTVLYRACKRREARGLETKIFLF